MRAIRTVLGAALLFLASADAAVTAPRALPPHQLVASPASSSEDTWNDYQIIMWQPHTVAQNGALKALGITGGQVIADRSDNPASSGGQNALLLNDTQRAEALSGARLPWYVDNIATDFYSPYHIMSSNSAFQKVRGLYEANPNDVAAFTREPSLSDPTWLTRIRGRITRLVRAQRPYAPLFYNLADEPGLADTSAAWDFDFSASSLAGMRQWLRTQYRNLAALNEEWGSNFASWDQVMPLTTAQALRRDDGNYSSWADFKQWMDVAFARAIKAGSDAVHSADRRAYAAITGAQTPGPGGWDYSLLSNAVDLIEPYDYGGNLDIVRSLNPDMAIITTSFRDGSAETHRIWRELIHGSRGLILWEDPDKKFLRDDGTLDTRGREAAPYFGELRNGLGALLIKSRPESGPVALLYSPDSMRAEWLLAWQPKGDAWSRNGTSSAQADNGVNVFGNLLSRLGVAHQVVSPAMIENGDLRSRGYRVLILPDAVALSSAEADAIRAFVQGGGTVIADSEPALYDQHSRKLGSSLLADIFRNARGGASAAFSFGKGKAVYFVPDARAGDPSAGSDASSVKRLGEVLGEIGIEPPLGLRDFTGQPPRNVETHLFMNGRVRIAAFQRDYADLAGGNGASTNASTGGSGIAGDKIELSLPRESYIYDLRAKLLLARSERVALPLAPIEPALIAISDTPLPAPKITVSKRVRAGGTAELRLSFNGPSTASFHVLHLEVFSPTGENVLDYARNIQISPGDASKRLTLAAGEAAGPWKILVTDVLSGQTANAEFEVVRN